MIVFAAEPGLDPVVHFSMRTPAMAYAPGDMLCGAKLAAVHRRSFVLEAMIRDPRVQSRMVDDFPDPAPVCFSCLTLAFA